MEAMHTGSFREFFSRNSQPICFLFAYFILVVLGNLIFGSSYGLQAIALSGYPLSTLRLNHIFDAGFWILLFMPFAVTPAVVYTIKNLAKNKINSISHTVPEINEKWFAFLFTLATAYVILSFQQNGVADLFLSGKDSVSSVVARFEIRNRLHFTVFIVMQAIVPYLSYAAIINSSKKGGWFWLVAATLSIVIASSFFIMINMKWPVVLYYAGAVLAIFIHTEKYAYTKAIIGSTIVIAIYLLISTVVFRLAPQPVELAAHPQNSAPMQTSNSKVSKQENLAKLENTTSKSPQQIAHTKQDKANGSNLALENKIVTSTKGTDISAGESDEVVAAAERAAVLSETAVGAAPILMMHLLSRMSMPYPYYYQEFTDHPSACGGILAQARPKPKCRPSTYIYEKMFAFNNDQFLGQGTSPAAVHISGYAIGGWPVAFGALLCASIIMGVLSSMPLNASSTVSAFGIMGALAGYHFSQIPGEGVIFYEHGLFWTLIFITAYSTAIWVINRPTNLAEAVPV